MEKGTFERSIRDAFDTAEVAPSGAVWTGVELGLEKTAAAAMKKRVLYYQLLAAASLFLTLGVTGLYFISLNSKDSDILTIEQSVGTQNEGVTDITSSKPIPDDRANQDVQSNNYEANLHQQALKKGNGNVTSSWTTMNGSNRIVLLPAENKENEMVVSDVANHAEWNFPKPINPIMEYKVPEVKFAHLESNADPGMVLLAKVQDEENKYAESNKRSYNETIWTSVGFSAGSFNPNTPQSTVVQSASVGNQFTSYDNNPAAGSSYSVGLQVGGRVGGRIVLLGGISYLTQNSSYTSNTASLESSALKASLNDLAYSNNQSIATSPYEVASNLQYVSLPVQAGYVALDRDFAIQLNGGISTDFFMLNTLTPSADNISRFTQGSGSDSPFRPVTFSGLVGTEFSYRFSDRYRIAVNPGIRYALSSIYKSGSIPDASPITYDVALRFRYLFK